jgi:hypothetical protein
VVSGAFREAASGGVSAAITKPMPVGVAMTRHRHRSLVEATIIRAVAVATVVALTTAARFARTWVGACGCVKAAPRVSSPPTDTADVSGSFLNYLLSAVRTRLVTAAASPGMRSPALHRWCAHGGTRWRQFPEAGYTPVRHAGAAGSLAATLARNLRPRRDGRPRGRWPQSPRIAPRRVPAATARELGASTVSGLHNAQPPASPKTEAPTKGRSRNWMHDSTDASTP